MRRTVVIAAVLTLGAFGVPATGAFAATPDNQTVTVPTTVGHTVTRTWTGTIPAGSAHPTSECDSVPAGVRAETLTINAPANYNTVSATFTLSIHSTPATPDETVNDEILTVMNTDSGGGGGEEGGSVRYSDTSNTTETVSGTDIQGGHYEVQACGFVNTTPQPYTGTLVIRTTRPNSETSLPAAPANGLAFSASVAADPQRSESEPLIETGPDGRTYTCGPTGFSNASDYAQESTDGGDQFHLLGTPPRGQQGVGGGGDCAINLAKDKNSAGNYQYAYAGLGSLTGFTTTTSADNGHTLLNVPVQGSLNTDKGVLTDRQWNVFTDAQTVLLSYNQQQPRNIVVQKSTDGGLTYGPLTASGGARPDFPGPMRALPPQFNVDGHRVVFFAWTKGSDVNLSVSKDNGATFT